MSGMLSSDSSLQQQVDLKRKHRSEVPVQFLHYKAKPGGSLNIAAKEFLTSSRLRM